MFNRIALSAVAGAALLAGCAAGPQSPPVESSTGARQAVAQNKDDDVVCIHQHTTGSHLAKVICTTKEERAQAMSQDRRDYSNMTQPLMGGSNSCSGPKCL